MEQDSVERANQVRLMEKFKLMAKQPHVSYNVYEELDIDNLRKFYHRAVYELNDFRKFFKIKNEQQESRVLSQINCSHSNKSELRKNFEELCYVSKITQEDVQEYIQALN